jgi:hypothetical protein
MLNSELSLYEGMHVKIQATNYGIGPETIVKGKLRFSGSTKRWFVERTGVYANFTSMEISKIDLWTPQYEVEILKETH